MQERLNRVCQPIRQDGEAGWVASERQGELDHSQISDSKGSRCKGGGGEDVDSLCSKTGCGVELG